MRWQTFDTIRSQHGVISRKQLLANGESDRSIAGKLNSGAWVTLAPGVYFADKAAPSDYALAYAAQLATGAQAIVSGATALRIYGVRCDAPERVTVLVPHSQSPQPNALIAPKRCVVMPEPVRRGPLRLTSIPRAVLDSCIGVRTFDAARARLTGPVQQRRCTPEQLIAHACTAGRLSPLVRQVLDEVVGGIRSVPEGQIRKILTDAGFPEARWNVPLYTVDGQFLFTPDAYWEEAGLVLEVQSKEFHYKEADWEATMARTNRMPGYGLLLVQITPARIRTDPQGVLAEIHAAYAEGLTRPPARVATLRDEK